MSPEDGRPRLEKFGPDILFGLRPDEEGSRNAEVRVEIHKECDDSAAEDVEVQAETKF